VRLLPSWPTKQTREPYLLRPSPAAEIDALAAACDVIGVNIYPFFTNGGNNPADPMAALRAQWAQMQARFPTQAHKLRLTEIGWPTQG
jgi:exo-beta-1,3-glucanase (GH17 family)